MRYIFLSIYIFITFVSAYSRTISGNVFDENNNPVVFASVVLLSCDSTYVSSSTTSESGYFEVIDDDSTGRMLNIQYIGFLTKIIKLDNHNTGNINLSKILLDEDINVLSEVTVTARKPIAVMKGGALVTTIENSVLAYSGTANDVLGQLPTVTNENGIFKVLGRGTPVIYINGRLMRSNLELEQLKSSDIKTVEVISNPGTRYSSSVNSIIKITTVSGGDNGWSVSGRTANKFNHTFSTVNNAEINFRKDRLDVFAILQASDEHEKLNDYYSMVSEMQDSSYYQNMSSDEKSHTSFFQGKIGFNLRINENHSFGGWYSYDFSREKNNIYYNSDVFANNNLLEKTHTQSYERCKTLPNHGASLYYAGKIRDLTIDFNADWTYTNTSSYSVQHEETEYPIITDRYVISGSRYIPKLYAQKLVLEYPVWKGKIQLGEETTWTSSTTEVNGDEDVLKSSKSKVEEFNSGVFLELNQSFGSFNIGAGIRYEHTSFNYYSEGKLVPNQSKIYNNLFPSVGLSCTVGNVGLNLSYTDHMQRPSYSRLRGTTTYINKLLYTRGNPFLLPSRDKEISLQSLWRDLFGQVTFIHHKNAISNIFVPYNDSKSGASLLTFANFQSFNELNIGIAYSPKFGIWRPSLQISMSKQWFNSSINGVQFRLNRPLYNVRFRNTLQLPADIMLNVNMSWQSKGNYVNYGLESCLNTYIRIYRYFFDKKVGVFLEANDILKKSESSVTVYSGPISSIEKVLHDTRYIQVTLSLNLNVKDKLYKGKGAGNQEKKRLL